MNADQFSGFGGIPSINQLNFIGKYKEKFINNIPRSNMPHLKRIINQ
jgi:hypothetical protein